MPVSKNGFTTTQSAQYKEHHQSKIQYGETRRVRELTTVVPKLIDTVTIAPGHYTHQIQLIGKLKAGPIEEGQEISTPDGFAAFHRQFTTSNWGSMVFFTDKINRQTATHSVSTELSKRQGEAMARLEEQEIIGLFETIQTKIDVSGNVQTSASDKTVTSGPASGNKVQVPKGLNPSTLAYAKGDIIRERDPQLGAAPMGSRPFGVFSPSAVTQMTTNLFSQAPADATAGIGGPAAGGGGAIMKGGTVAIPNGLTEDIVRNYYVGEAGGVNIYETPNVQVCQNTGTTAKVFDTKYGEELTDSVAAGNYFKSVSPSNATSIGAVLIPQTLMMVKEMELNMDEERVPRMQGRWQIATQEFKPYVVYDAWGVAVYTMCGVLSSQPAWNVNKPHGFA